MRKLRFIFSSLFIILTCSFFNISASAAETVFDIETDAEWLEMCNTVNSMTMSTSNTVTINLLADIDLTQVSAYSTNCNIQSKFYGTINGNNHIISNGNFSVDTDGYLGLINYCSFTDISKLVLYNCTYSSDLTDINCGSFAGYFGGYSDLYSLYSVSNVFDFDSVNYVGGVVGKAAGGSTNCNLCYNFSDLKFSNGVAIGGIIGYLSSGNSISITRCANYGDVGYFSLSSGLASGLVGESYTYIDSISCCYNLGNIYAYVCSGIYINSRALTSYMASCYSFIDSNGYDNLTMAYAPLWLTKYTSLPDSFLRNYNFGLSGFDNISGGYYSYSNYVVDKSAIDQTLVDDLNNGYTVFQLDADNINNGFPVFVESYDFLKTVILPLINGGSTPGIPDSWVTLDGRAEGTFDSETGKFEYNITVNSPDYSSTLGDPNYTGSYTIPGEADDVGVDINDTSGFDNILSSDFSSLFLGIPFVLALFSSFLDSHFTLLFIFILLIALIAWFFGRKV